MSQFIRRKHIKVLALCAMVLLLPAGGTAVPEPQQTEQTETSPNLVQCTEPRPQMCTMEYLPVCADLRDGTRRTYASGCVACADADVVGYRPDQCG
jgi:hypothetical protein